MVLRACINSQSLHILYTNHTGYFFLILHINVNIVDTKLLHLTLLLQRSDCKFSYLAALYYLANQL